MRWRPGPGFAFFTALALACASASAQDRVTAGAGDFAAGTLRGCDTDLLYLNQMFGWQTSWPRRWEALASASDADVAAAIALWRTASAALEADRRALSATDPRRIRAPRVVVARVLAQLDALTARLGQSAPPLRPGVAPALHAQWTELFAREIAPAIARHAAFLRPIYRPGASDGLGDAACFRKAVRRSTSLDIAPERIEAIGRRLLAQSGRQLARLYHVPLGQLPRLVARLRDARDPGFTEDRLVQVSQAAIARAEAALPTMFARPLRAPVTVRPMARDMEASFPAGFYEAASGDAPAAYVVNRSRPAERVLMAEVIAFHETLPGHHIQAALGYPEGTFNSGFLEGWGIYAEYLADEMGLYSNARARAGMMAKHLWAASRLIVEPGLHLHGWTRAQAIAFMRAHTALSDAEIALEVDRYIALPGQSLSYMLGYDRIRAARSYAEARLGHRFDVRRFHEMVLGAGSRPLDRMYAEVVRWAANGGA